MERYVESKGMRVNMNKIKVMISGKRQVRQKAVRWPCGVCSKGVGSNSLQCTSCQKWVHKKCSGIRGSVSKVAKSFICRGCLNPVTSAGRTSVEIGASTKLELVDKFCYLGDMLIAECGMEMLMQLWRPELELVGISSGSWYHCLPIRTCL